MKTTCLIIGLLSLGGGLAFFGCQVPPATPAPAEPPAVAQRGWPEYVIRCPATGVEHPTVYLRDPFESGSREDGYFRTFTLEDIFVTLASPAVFAGNVAAMPVAAAVAPPWQAQCSHSLYSFTGEPRHELVSPPSGMLKNDPVTPSYRCHCKSSKKERATD